ncbi:uncharacterized protein K460DRAFT_353687 [Cucurbitaria berberidis CBS 394.84]|uniref:Uncharacterized protein n=1 Tax=Cucurbitaria berberidis CBS 394.84 TaxID=1168544 RepID=A0A9P4GLU5_9PLEO|nr:uncharacterized protein K460DRAFT_353687 [Cucurbitaria berberidis CBS 394.84]KAF1848743.1 hypothetical protein K460DRAFT_353687 [Cucurbitaria berberidis CBS 394.84]
MTLVQATWSVRGSKALAGAMSLQTGPPIVGVERGLVEGLKYNGSTSGTYFDAVSPLVSSVEDACDIEHSLGAPIGHMVHGILRTRDQIQSKPDTCLRTAVVLISNNVSLRRGNLVALLPLAPPETLRKGFSRHPQRSEYPATGGRLLVLSSVEDACGSECFSEPLHVLWDHGKLPCPTQSSPLDRKWVGPCPMGKVRFAIHCAGASRSPVVGSWMLNSMLWLEKTDCVGAHPRPQEAFDSDWRLECYTLYWCMSTNSDITHIQHGDEICNPRSQHLTSKCPSCAMMAPTVTTLTLL